MLFLYISLCLSNWTKGDYKKHFLRYEIRDLIGTLLDACSCPPGDPWLVYVNYIRDWEGKANELEEMT